jgi:predicted DNA-binding ribbon-helix-helix protein
MTDSGRNQTKRSVTIAGHRTSLSLEEPFWEELKAWAAEEGLSLNGLVARLDEERQGNLSSCLRVAVLERLRGRLRSAEEAAERLQP